MRKIDPEVKKNGLRKYQKKWRKENIEKIRKAIQRYCNSDKGRATRKAWVRNNLQRARQIWRKSQLKRRFNMTEKDYENLVSKQKGLCPICQKPLDFSKKKPPIDHSGLTGNVRGVLHDTCNKGLGLLGDSSKICQNAARYLRKNND